jgi:hypothetical protein
VTLPRRRQLAPAKAGFRPSAELLLAAERVENRELIGRTRQPTLLELAGHGQEPLAERGDVLPGGAPPPRVGAGAPLGGDPACEDDALLVLRPELGQPRERLLVEQDCRQVELRLDVGVCTARPHGRGFPLRAEE